MVISEVLISGVQSFAPEGVLPVAAAHASEGAADEGRQGLLDRGGAPLRGLIKIELEIEIEIERPVFLDIPKYP